MRDKVVASVPSQKEEKLPILRTGRPVLPTAPFHFSSSLISCSRLPSGSLSALLLFPNFFSPFNSVDDNYSIRKKSIFYVNVSCNNKVF